MNGYGLLKKEGKNVLGEFFADQLKSQVGKEQIEV